MFYEVIPQHAPRDLQTLLAWYGDGRWPCGLASAPREGRATAILIC
jgi:hypothetical protein